MTGRSALFLALAAAIGCQPDDPAPDGTRVPADTTAVGVPATGTGTGSAAGTPNSTAAESDDPTRLTPHGWGPLRIGMTRAEVVAAVGQDANPDAVGGPEPEACDEWQPANAPSGILIMVERDTLTRITLMRDSEVRTPAGLGLGDSASTVLAKYGSAAEVTPHKYIEEPASYITVWASGPDSAEPRGLVYVTGREGTVTHVHAGGPSIQYVEGCL